MRPITSTLSDSRLGSRRAIAIEERPFHPLQRLIGRRPDAAVSRTRCTTPREAEVIGSERPRAPTIPTASCHDRCEDGHGRFFMLSQFRPSTVASDARTRRGRRRRATPSAADQGDAVNYCKTMSTPGDGSRGWRAARFCSSVAVGACPLLDLPEVGLPDGTVGHRHCRGDDASAPRTGRDRNR